MKTLESVTNIGFKNILFLTDLTEASEAAFSYAIAFARQYDACLYPGHVVVPQVPSELEAPLPSSLLRAIEEQKRAQLANAVKDTGITTRVLVQEGFVDNVVPRWINEHGIDLIVAGTHGRRGIQRLLLGSTAELILRTASCPVLTVGPNVERQPAGGLRINKVLFATDLSEETEFAASYALSFARQHHAQLTFLHVLPVENRSHAEQMQASSNAQNELRRLAPSDARLGCEIAFVVEQGDPGERILTYAARKAVDLIVLGLPRNKKFTTHFRSGVTYEVISSATRAVLTMRSLA